MPKPKLDNKYFDKFFKTTFKKIIIVSLIVAVALCLLTWGQYKISSNSLTTGFNVYYPYTFDIGCLISILVCLALCVLLLRRLLKLQWEHAFFMSLPAICFVGSTFIYDASVFNFISLSVIDWFGGYPWRGLVYCVFLLLSLSVAYIAYTLFPKINNFIFNIFVVLSAILIGLVILLHWYELQSSINTIVQAGRASNSDTSTDVDTSTLNFTVYQPTYIPTNYVDQDQELFGSGYIPQYYDSSQAGNLKMPNSVYFDYQDGSREAADSGSFSGYDQYRVSSYKTPSDFNPPFDCGVDIYGNNVHNCNVIGHSTLGCDVYLGQDATNFSPQVKLDDFDAYCTIGNTTVNIDLNDSLVTGVQPTSQTDYNQIIQVINSLQEYDGSVEPSNL